MEPYRAPWWLQGGHSQTILGGLLGPGQSVAYTRERWTTPDGDFVDVDWAGPENAERLLVMFHGLEDNSRSRVARAVAQRALAMGNWRYAMPHFRGCSGSPNLRPRAYHAGDSEEADWMLRRFAALYPAVHAVGISLGGNVLLKWLGEQGDTAVNVVRRAVTVCAPFDVTAFGENIGRGFNNIYGWYFLYVAGLRRKALMKIKQFPAEFAALGISASCVRAIKTLPEYDDVVTAPLHGFGNKFNYWRLASAVNVLPQIRVPTLILNARNDPFLPERVLAKASDLPRNLVLEFPSHGGHVGFPSHSQWLPRRIVDFLLVPKA